MPAFSRFLRYFMAVGRLGSIRRAADELHVSASAIDRQILNVEAELGMPLFERLPTGLRLTAAGEIMMAAGSRWQKNMTAVRTQIEDLRGLKRGHVEIAIIDALAKGYVPAAVQAIQARYPGITIGVKVLENGAVRDAVLSGDVDMGLLFDPQSYRDLQVRAFVEVVLGFLAPPGHPIGDAHEARFSRCQDVPLVLPSRPLAVCQQVEVLIGTTGLEPRRQVTSDNVQMIVSLVLQGLGVGVLTSLDVMTEVRQGLLSFTRITDPVLRPMTLALCTAAQRVPSHAASMVLDEIEAGFAQLAYAPPAGSEARSASASPDTSDENAAVGTPQARRPRR